MAIYTPKFEGVWVIEGQTENTRETSLVKYNKDTKAYLIRILQNTRILKRITKKTDCDSSDANGDHIAIEDINKPDGDYPWRERLQSAEVHYNPETGIATCSKVLVEDEETWTKVRDLPVNTSRARIV